MFIQANIFWYNKFIIWNNKIENHSQKMGKKYFQFQEHIENVGHRLKKKICVKRLFRNQTVLDHKNCLGMRF